MRISKGKDRAERVFGWFEEVSPFVIQKGKKMFGIHRKLPSLSGLDVIRRLHSVGRRIVDLFNKDLRK